MADIIFTISAETSIADARTALRASHVEITQVLDELGMILGQAEDFDLAKLRQLPEFLSVDLDTPIEIEPPDAPVQ